MLLRSSSDRPSSNPCVDATDQKNSATMSQLIASLFPTAISIDRIQSNGTVVDIANPGQERRIYSFSPQLLCYESGNTGDRAKALSCGPAKPVSEKPPV